jgi:3-hydroxybutyryl-CoA dehydrogenase
MGRSIALAFALAQHEVSLVDVSVESLRAAESRLAVDLSALGHADQVGTALQRLTFTTSLEDAVARAELVIESVPEDLDLKRGNWARLGQAAPDAAVLATNTSSFDVALFSAVVPRPERVLGLHWFNPAHLVPCVEIVRAPSTSEKVVQDMERLLIDMGKKPAVVRSTPGFVANRIQMAMAAEAFRCLEEGIASAEAIDDIVRFALGFRLVDLGPFALADLAGMDVYDAIYRYLTETLGERFTTPERVRELAARGDLGVKTGSGIYSYTPEQAEAVVKERDIAFAQRATAPAST